MQLEEKYLQTLRRIVAEDADSRMWQPVIFGSRATGKAARFSDIDLGFIGPKPLPLAIQAKLWEALDDSDIPYVIDVVDLSQTDRSFREVAEKSMVPML